MLGTLLAQRYEIVQFLGQGGFAETYLAMDKQMPFNPQCVVKRLKPQSNDPATLKAARKLFNREAKVLSDLGNHNQIPQILAYFEENEEFYIIEEYIEGEDLETEFISKAPVNEQDVISLLEDVLSILTFVHQHQVIHRDIKPSNLIRRRQDGKIVLIDFGAVKQVQTQVVTAGGGTSFLTIIGSPGYMPNEQLRGKPCFSSDIYALGMTAIYGLTGNPISEFTEDPKTGEITWRSQAKVSNKLAVIIDKMVRHNYHHRYENAQQVIQDLKKISSKISSIPNKIRSTVIIESIRTKFSWFKPWYLLISLLAIIGTGGVYLLGSSLFNSSSKIDVAQASKLRDQGYEQINSDQNEEAITTFEKALKFNPNDVKSWQGKGLALQKLERYEEAVKAYSKALTLKPDDVDLLNRKGVALAKDDKLKEAIDCWDTIIKIDPNDSTVWNNKSWALARQGETEKALEAVNKALELSPNDFDAWDNKADILLDNAKDYEQAVDAYNKVISIDPTFSSAWVDKGQALYQLKRYSEALYSYEEAIRIKSDDADAWLGKGKVLEELGKIQEALSAYDQAIQLKPDLQEAIEARKKLNSKAH